MPSLLRGILLSDLVPNGSPEDWSNVLVKCLVFSVSSFNYVVSILLQLDFVILSCLTETEHKHQNQTLS